MVDCAVQAWLGATVMVGLTLQRRANYELFYYAHQFAIVFLIIAVMHAWSFWYVFTTYVFCLYIYIYIYIYIACVYMCVCVCVCSPDTCFFL